MRDEISRPQEHQEHSDLHSTCRGYIFRKEDDEFICQPARTVDDAKVLIEAGFNYVCEFDGVKLFKKRK